MKNLSFLLLTPEKKVLEKMVSQVGLPTFEGEITILPDHVPLIGLIKSGTIHLKNEESEEFLAVSGGFFRVSGQEVRILADTAERAEDLDNQVVEEAKKRAEEALVQAKNTETVDYSGMTAILERELARLKTLHKHHSKRGMHLNS